MVKHKFLKLRYLFFFVLLFACSSHSHWTSDQVVSNQKEFSSTKLSYLSKDPAHGIDLEFLKLEERLNVYLNVHSIPVPPHQSNQKSALLKIDVDGEIIRCEIYRLEGGQRFLLSDELAQIVIKSLQNNKEITFTLQGYRSTIKAEDFSKKLNQLLHPFPLQNPFSLPR
jgi:hypothetical protein